MRLISLILALSIIGMIVYKQLNTTAPSLQVSAATDAAGQGAAGSPVPKVTSNPNDLKKFEKDIQTFVKDSAETNRKEIEDASITP